MKACCFCAVIMLCAGPCMASIGIHFYLTGEADQALGAGETAGHPDVEQVNWNSFSSTELQPALCGSGYTSTNTFATVVDDTGATVSGMEVKATPGHGYWDSWQPVTAGVAGTPNGKLFRGMCARWNGQEARIFVTGIPYATYDLYVYWSIGGSAGAWYEEMDGDLTVTDGGALNENIGFRCPANYGTLFDGTFVEADPVTPNTYSTHYVWTGLTAQNLAFSFEGRNNPDPGDNVSCPGTRWKEDGPGIAGIQIVATGVAPNGTVFYFK